jgi:hypothetical protein
MPTATRRQARPTTHREPPAQRFLTGRWHRCPKLPENHTCRLQPGGLPGKVLTRNILQYASVSVVLFAITAYPRLSGPGLPELIHFQLFAKPLRPQHGARGEVKIMRRHFVATIGFLLFSPLSALHAQQTCVAGPTIACLNNGRFSVSVNWQDFGGNAGPGSLVPYSTDDSQLFWFFDPSNWEMLVKVIDGCALNGHFWVFSAATSNVQYTLTVADTFTGDSQTYFNKLGTAAPAVTDTSAFAACTASRPAAFAELLPTPRRHEIAAPQGAKPQPRATIPFVAQASCNSDPTHTCLNGGRFRTEVSWQDSSGNSGSGQVSPFGSDDSALFWFFDPTNWEMLVKVLDGCALNNRFWVFSAATTNVQYTLRVTDTFTGNLQEYSNAQGVAAPAVTDTAAFDSCQTSGPPQIQFVTDRSVSLTHPGDQAHFQVQVLNGDGQPIQGAAVNFTVADPSLVSITKDGPLSATVTALSPPPGSTTVTATYGTSTADAMVLLAVPSSGTVLITSDLVLSKATGALTLQATPLTRSLTAGQILVSGDRAGVLDRITSVTAGSGSIGYQTTPVSLADAFDQLTVGESGSAAHIRATVAPASSGFIETTYLNGRVVSVRNADGFSCMLDGADQPSVQITNPSITVDAELVPKAFLDLSHGVNDFRVTAEGTVTVSVSTGGIQLSSKLGAMVTCSSTLGTFEPVHFFVEGFDFALDLTPVIGVNLAADFNGPGLSLEGPSGSVTGSLVAGIEYTPSAGWQAIQQHNLSGQMNLLSFQSNPGSGFSASITPFARVDIGLRVALGFDIFSVDLANLKFAEIEASTPFGFQLSGPIDTADPAYVGPTWNLGLELQGSLDAELTGGALSDLLDRVGVDKTFAGPQQLFDAILVLPGSPSFKIEASPSQVDAAAQQAVNLSVSSSQPVSGSMEFLSTPGSGSALAMASMNSGVGASSWTPAPSQAGTYKVFGLAQVDPISLVFPYRSSNSVTLVVSDSQGSSPGPAPSISSVSPDPVPGSNNQQEVSISGNNFATGANITLRDLTSGQAYPNRTTTSLSSTEITLNADFGTSPDTWSVEIINPDGQSSGQFQFRVSNGSGGGAPAPTIASVSPNPVPGSNSAQPFTINGNNFVAGANVTLRDLTAGQTFANRASTSFSSTQIVLDSIFGTSPDNWSVEVINPDGQSSSQFQFRVSSGGGGPAPTIASVSPNPVPGSSSAQPFTINGNNFVAGANVTLRDLTAGQTFANRASTSFSSTQIVLDPIFSTSPDSWSVEVINPNGESSGQFDFQVSATSPAPVINSVSPNPVPGSSSAQPFTINGNNFVAGANVTLRDLTAGQTFANRASTSFSSTQIVLDPIFTTAAHSWSVEVINPNGESSGQYFFNVT